MDNANNMSQNINQQMPYFSDINIHEYVDHTLNFDNQLIEMLRGEAPTNDLINNVGVNDNFDPHILSRNVLEDHGFNNQFCGVDSGDVFNQFNSPTMSATNNNTLLNSFDDDGMNKDGDEDEDDEDAIGEGGHSSATTNTKKSKVDRSRTLVSERRRRGRMKEKLYALRALVPNITKMDKASIIGDAVRYVQDLQTQAKKLKSQIEGLESSYKAAERCQSFVDTPHKNTPPQFIPVCNKLIMQMDVLQIESGEFYVKVVSNKGQGVAASLYKALDCLNSFMVQCSNLTTLSEQFVLTFTLNVGNSTEDLNLASLKLWITGAFVNQGFELRTF